MSFHIFTLPDRRPTAVSSQSVKWLYQMDVESFLYNHDDESRGTGAFYRLLQRTPGAAGRALCLRKASVGKGLITDAEWDALREPFLSGLRVLTLVPVDVAFAAIAVFGETARSAALINASDSTGLPNGSRRRTRLVRRRARRARGGRTRRRTMTKTGAAATLGLSLIHI